VVFRCNWAKQPAAASAEKAKTVRVACVGRISAGLILRAIEAGASSVHVSGCSESECRHLNGVRLAQAQVGIARGLLHLLGQDPGRTCLAGEDGDER
jgi:coenzyme F420-reducing hydrogenase delta subunit